MQKLIIFFCFFIICTSLKADNVNKNKCESLSYKAEKFCKNFINNSYEFLGSYSGIENQKKLMRELAKCSRFQISFPTFCEIFKNKIMDYLIHFILTYTIVFFVIYCLRKRKTKSIKC